ncbi:MAG TPA: isochorismatase family protein [Candidatus Paceibacterota bacterium]
MTQLQELLSTSCVGALCVDMQNDFMGLDDGSPYEEKVQGQFSYSAALAVKGGLSASKRAGAFIRAAIEKIRRVVRTSDAHRRQHIAHPYGWLTNEARQISPFAEVTLDQLVRNEIRLKDSNTFGRVSDYLAKLESRGKRHRIWPPHCIVTTWGQATERTIGNAIEEWEVAHGASAFDVAKGGAIWREHFGGIEAEVPDESDPQTLPNEALLNELRSMTAVLVFGLALDYCVAETMRQMIKHLGPEYAKRMILVIDCTAAIDPAAGETFLNEMRAAGVTVASSIEILASMYRKAV